MALNRQLVLLFAGHVPLLRDVLGHVAQREVTIHGLGHVAGAVLSQGIHKHRVLVAHAVPGAAQTVHALVQAVHAAGHHDVQIAAGDHLSRVKHGLNAGAAGTVSSGGGDAVGQTGLQPGVAGHVHGPGAGLGLTHHHAVDQRGIDARPVDDGAEHACGQLVGRDLLQSAAAGADGRAYRMGNYDFSLFHISTSFLDQRAPQSYSSFTLASS